MRLGGLALLMAGGAVAGCTGAVSAPGVAGDAESVVVTTSAVVIVERTVDATQGVRAAASARFVRVASPSSMLDALHAIGAAGDLPARGVCATLTSLTGGVAAEDPPPVVELVDVGAVSLEAGGAETRLVPRQLPDVTDVVSGVVYARATDPTLLPAASRYGVNVAGRVEFGAFHVSVVAPADPGRRSHRGRDRGRNDRGDDVLDRTHVANRRNRRSGLRRRSTGGGALRSR